MMLGERSPRESSVWVPAQSTAGFKERSRPTGPHPVRFCISSRTGILLPLWAPVQDNRGFPGAECSVAECEIFSKIFACFCAPGDRGRPKHILFNLTVSIQTDWILEGQGKQCMYF